MEFIPRVTPRWESPWHLAPYVEALERAPGAGLRICFAAPPQHTKSETTCHFLAKLTRDKPELRNAYSTYSGDRAQRVGRNAANIAERAGVALTTANLDIWRTKEGGQTLWTSVGGGMTGEPIDGVAIVDDPIKDRQEAESAVIRQNHKDWYHSVLESRLHPGASVIVMMTRWHPDDLVGYLVKNCGFTYINLKAIADENRPPGDNRKPGEALWPTKRPLEFLQERQRTNPWNFAGMYQGEPQPRGSAVFGQPTYYRELPEKGFRVVYGADLAYSQKKLSKFSVLVELWAVPPAPGSTPTIKDKPYLDWRFYVVSVHRKQVPPPEFGLVLKSAVTTRRGKIHMYGTGVEEGATVFFNRANIKIEVMNTHGRDKFQRSIVTSEIWNAGGILVPEDAEANPWIDEYLGEMMAFTGVNDAFADQTDATVSGIDAALKGSGMGIDLPNRNGGSGRWS